MSITKALPKLALAALFAAGSASAVVASEAVNPSNAADAQGYRVWHPGYYSYQGRYWAHRRWHPAYWGPGHRWTPGFYIYF